MPIFRCSTCETSRRGFTVIELIITFAIITALMAATAPSAAFNRREYILSTNQEQLRSLINRAKSLTLSGLLTPEEPGEKICGYGIRIDARSATIFKETLSNSVDCPRDGIEGIKHPDVDTLLTGSTLNQMIFDRALSISLSADNQGNTPLDIYFVAPDPLTVITAGDPPDEKEWATITLGLAPSSRQIKINKAGLIDLIYETAQQ